MPSYNCSKCPGYCCSYQIIPVTSRDLERLARHFGLSVAKARKKFVVRNDEEHLEDGDYKMRRKADEHFGRVCRFFDTEKRCCTVYQARPSICRAYPTGRCGYYDFLSNERKTQDDPELVASTWNA
ncbi:MAG: YkgJ family cysteine cluster protein [Alphaproteobacteria bacterium]|nr:YkgJ family cysteine cluster protein [Alphaproteobacteria bacterium]